MWIQTSQEAVPVLKKKKLNYRFHNPNTAEKTADYLLKVLFEANTQKVEQAIRCATDRQTKKAQKECLV